MVNVIPNARGSQAGPALIPIPALQSNKAQRQKPPKMKKSSLVPMLPTGVKQPKQYAANGVRMSPCVKQNMVYEGLPIEAYSGKQSYSHSHLYQGYRNKSPRSDPHTSPVRMNPNATEFSPRPSSLGMSPLAKAFTPNAAVGLSPLAAPFVPSAIPVGMPLMSLGESLRAAMAGATQRVVNNPAVFFENEKVYEVYDFASL